MAKGGQDQKVKLAFSAERLITIMDTYKNCIYSSGTNTFSTFSTLLFYVYYCISLATFSFLMSYSLNRILGSKHHLECGAREWIEFESIS